MDGSQASFDTEEVVNVYSQAHDGPQPYNYQLPWCQRDQEQTRVRRNNGQRREIELLCEENQWRSGQVSGKYYIPGKYSSVD